MTSTYGYQLHQKSAAGLRQHRGSHTSRHVIGRERRGRSEARKRIWVRKALLSACTIMIMLIAVSGPLSKLFYGNSASASAEQNLTEIQYKIIEIHKGDTLWSIAKDNMGPGYSDIYNYIEDIRTCNQLKSDYISSGNYLMIPYYEISGTDVASVN